MCGATGFLTAGVLWVGVDCTQIQVQVGGRAVVAASRAVSEELQEFLMASGGGASGATTPARLRR